MAETTRGRLLALRKEHPDWTAAILARALGVSRERVRQLAEAEGLELPQGPFTPSQDGAQLAGAAGVMLDALKAIASAYASNGSTKRQKAAWAKVRAAIALATGKTAT